MIVSIQSDEKKLIAIKLSEELVAIQWAFFLELRVAVLLTLIPKGWIVWFAGEFKRSSAYMLEDVGMTFSVEDNKRQISDMPEIHWNQQLR